MTKPVFYVVNKIDGERHEGDVPDFYHLGVSVLYSISAEHGRGIGELMDEVVKVFPSAPPEEERVEGRIRVALVGRPNVGKSSLLNKLIRRHRAIVGFCARDDSGCPRHPFRPGGPRVYLHRYGRYSAQEQSHPATGKVFGHQSAEKPGTVRCGPGPSRRF